MSSFVGQHSSFGRRSSPKVQRRRSSFVAKLSTERYAQLKNLEKRVVDAEAAIKADSAAVLRLATGDSMEPNQLDLLNSNPDERTGEQIDALSQLISQLAPTFANSLSDAEMAHAARNSLYHFFETGDVICDPDEYPAFFFVILHGTCEVSERQIYHKENPERTNRGRWRSTLKRAGESFHHFPLVVNADTYGYAAKVAGEGGCSLLLISRTDYLQHLRRSVEREMNETVTFLKDAQFFSAWTEYAMSRLYFCFEKAKS